MSDEVSGLDLQRTMNALGSKLTEDGGIGPKSRSELMLYLREVRVLRGGGARDTIPVPSGDIEIEVEVETMPPTLKDSGLHRMLLPYHERVLAWCLAEADHWGTRKVDTDRVASYVRGCKRLVLPTGTILDVGADLERSIRAGNAVAFCASARGFAEASVYVPGDLFTAPWRASALEIRDDAKAGRRPGECWLSVAECLAKRIWPHPGAIAIYHNVNSTWQGHAETVIVAGPEGFRSSGANELGGKWHNDDKAVDYRRASRSDGVQRLALEGFVVRIEP